MGMAVALAVNINATATMGNEINKHFDFMALAPFDINVRQRCYPAPARTGERAETSRSIEQTSAFLSGVDTGAIRWI
jgi:hypothetical protein